MSKEYEGQLQTGSKATGKIEELRQVISSIDESNDSEQTAATSTTVDLIDEKPACRWE